MAYRITEVLTAAFPSEDAVAEALASAGVVRGVFTHLLRAFTCQAPLVDGKGYQVEIARELERYLKAGLERSASRPSAPRQYHPDLNEVADVAIGVGESGRRIFVELEFRPNVEKDLVKFQLGANAGRLHLAVLILAIDRNAVNPGYTSMPQFHKFERVIRALAPAYPLLLCGFRGKHDA